MVMLLRNYLPAKCVCMMHEVTMGTNLVAII